MPSTGAMKAGLPSGKSTNQTGVSAWRAFVGALLMRQARIVSSSAPQGRIALSSHFRVKAKRTPQSRFAGSWMHSLRGWASAKTRMRQSGGDSLVPSTSGGSDTSPSPAVRGWEAVTGLTIPDRARACRDSVLYVRTPAQVATPTTATSPSPRAHRLNAQTSRVVEDPGGSR